MRLDNERESDNVEDRRGEGGRGGFGVGRGVGIGTVILALAASYFLGIDPSVMLGLFSGGGTPAPRSVPVHKPPAGDEMARFVSKVLADTEDTWRAIFRQTGRQYQDPRLVLFTGATPTACGTGQTAMGPFYCPEDQKVYIDLAFYQDLKARFKAPGDFAQAYVIAHEVGHHVQHLLGISDKVQAARSRASERQANALSVRLELQADCLAGVWGYHADRVRNILEAGDIEEALAAASAIGDDRLQQQGRGYAVPDTFTHGTSAQRVSWFKRGVESGDMRQCNTFESRQL
ncbi:MAG TPA: neutral zinc metallopeptidase [Candidatus Methylomirabilis sp.]|nr:neutral zinc metallopeptidase [Candidatus Methylomirabilis sp.]